MSQILKMISESVSNWRRRNLLTLMGSCCINSYKTYDDLVTIVKRKMPLIYNWSGQKKNYSSKFGDDLLYLSLVQGFFKDNESNSKFSIQYYNLDYVRYKITDEGRKEIERLLKNKKLIKDY